MSKRRSFLLYPFSILYRMATDIRNILYDTGILRSEKFELPVICVGNITAGGTGKTPHAEYLINLLRNDFSIALLSRGYKRKSRGFRIASQTSTTLEIGDEPLQISRKFPDILTAVDTNRVNGIKTIMREYPDTDLIILDDGFQHRSVKPGLSILLTDYSRIITGDYFLPYGNLRENPANRKRAGVIVVSKTPESATESERKRIAGELKTNESQKLFFTSVSYGDALPVYENHAPEKHLPGKQDRINHGAVVLTGIAVHQPLIEYLQGFFSEIIHIPFPDHHYYSEDDIEKAGKAFWNLKSREKMIITTEKDAVRLREFSNIDDSLKRAMYIIPVGISFPNGDKHDFDKMITDYVRRNKRNN